MLSELNPKLGLHPPEFFADLWGTVMARGVWQGELTNRCKDGRLVEVSLTVSPVKDASGAVLGTSKPISPYTSRRAHRRATA